MTNDYNPVELVRAAADGDGMNGAGSWWILLLFIILGSMGYNGRGGSAAGDSGMAVYPLMENQQNLFTGFGNVQNAICTGFANAETAATTRQMAGMQQTFGLSQQLSDCCCEQRVATANLGAQIASDGCSTRQAVNEAARDIMANDNANYQRIMDKLCQLELDGVKAQLAQAESDKAQLREELSAARFQASQTAQNGLIMQGFANEVDALYNRLNNCPVGTVPVAGNQPIFQMRPVQNNGCPAMAA